MAEKKTIWQRLASFINTKPTPASVSALNKNRNDGDKLIVAKSKEEFDSKIRQAKQSKYISNQFAKLVNNDYIQITQIESERRIALIDYEMMEYYPLIGSALDTIAEEATVIGENGKMLNIYSDNKRIKDELQNLFYETLNINGSLYQWTRNTVKLGDNFLYLLLDETDGVVGAKQMQNNRMTRVETFDYDTNEFVVLFQHEETSQIFNNFNMAHFRLIGDDSRLPYGISHLDKIRKIHKMLVLAEDALMIHRLTRGSSRFIYKVEVGNTNDADIDNYIQDVASTYKRQPQVESDGKVNFRFNVMNQTEDLYIPMRDGKPVIEIDKLEGEIKTEIADIEFLLNNLIAGLGIPRPLLGFDEAAGEGKNLSLLDARFARKINRIQQAMIQELNKIAYIHLYLKGFEDDLTNFSLSLSNPSIQTDVMRIEHLTNKFNAFQQATTVNDATQMSPYSETKARRDILGMSDTEIVDDIKIQFVERAIGVELREKVNQIKVHDMFSDLYKRFAKSDSESEKDAEQQEGSEDVGGDMGGGEDLGGGGDIGGDNPFKESRFINKIKLNESREKNLYNIIKEFENTVDSLLVKEKISKNTVQTLLEEVEPIKKYQKFDDEFKKLERKYKI